MDSLQELLRGSEPSVVRVALDVEGVLAEIMTPVLEVYNSIKGTSFEFKDVKDWDFKTIGTDYKEMMPIFNRVWIENWRNIKFDASTWTLNKLNSIYDLNIVTSREGVDDQIKHWLNMAGVQGIKLVINNPSREKTELDYQIYVDDSPILAGEVIKTKDKIILLLDRPWNQDVAPSDRVIRTPNVNEASRTLLSMVRGTPESVRRQKV